MICDRCHREALASGMSYFNTDQCCIPCLKVEREHPGYEAARRIEGEHVLRGDTKFAGVGKPADLRSSLDVR